MILSQSGIVIRDRPGPRGMARVIIDYPPTEEHRRCVLTALADLIRPPDPTPTAGTQEAAAE